MPWAAHTRSCPDSDRAAPSVVTGRLEGVAPQPPWVVLPRGDARRKRNRRTHRTGPAIHRAPVCVGRYRAVQMAACARRARRSPLASCARVPWVANGGASPATNGGCLASRSTLGIARSGRFLFSPAPQTNGCRPDRGSPLPRLRPPRHATRRTPNSRPRRLALGTIRPRRAAVSWPCECTEVEPRRMLFTYIFPELTKFGGGGSGSAERVPLEPVGCRMIPGIHV